MGDRIIITDDEDKPARPDVVVVAPQAPPKTEKVVTEKTTVTETRKEE
jgi:hypothetical protein